MRRLFVFSFTLLLFLSFIGFTKPLQTYAGSCFVSANPGVVGMNNTFKISGDALKSGQKYRVVLSQRGDDKQITNLRGNILEFHRSQSVGDPWIAGGTRTIGVWVDDGVEGKADGNDFSVCSTSYTLQPRGSDCSVVQEPKEPGIGQTVRVHFGNLGDVPEYVKVDVVPPSGQPGPTNVPDPVRKGDSFIVEISGFRSIGQHTVRLRRKTGEVFYIKDTFETLCSTSVNILENPGDQSAVGKDPGQAGTLGKEGKPVNVQGTCPSTGFVDTALGCIPVSTTNEFVKWVLGWALGIAGGIAFLLILGSGFIIMTASGKPEQLQHGRELLTAAISGLILIIFSVFLLQLIGVQILNIPGL